MNESIKILLESKTLFQTIMSDTYKSKLFKDFDILSEQPEDADIFFSIIPTNISNEYFLSYIMAYEYILSTLFNNNSNKFQIIHKGTPFYFLGILSFIIGDFERAVFYMDAAMSEDIRSYKFTKNTPSRLFFALDVTNQNHMALDIVKKIRKLIELMIEKVKNDGGPILTSENLTQKLISVNELRTIATAFLSFILEYDARKTQLIISPDGAGTGEPFILHLIKGVIIFESLIANSKGGKEVKKEFEKNKKIPTLKDYFKNDSIVNNLGLNKNLEGLNSATFEVLISKIEKIKKDEPKYSHQCIRVTWGIRNLLTHSIGWPKPSIQEYDILFNYIFGAICYAIDGLYSKDSE